MFNVQKVVMRRTARTQELVSGVRVVTGVDSRISAVVYMSRPSIVWGLGDD